MYLIQLLPVNIGMLKKKMELVKGGELISEGIRVGLRSSVGLKNHNAHIYICKQ